MTKPRRQGRRGFGKCSDTSLGGEFQNPTPTTPAKQDDWIGREFGLPPLDVVDTTTSPFDDADTASPPRPWGRREIRWFVREETRGREWGDDD